MKVILTAATELELHSFRTLSNVQGDLILDYWVTGVGPIATTQFLEKNSTAQSPDLIIQIGIAGAINDQIDIGSSVAVKEEMISDMGVWEADGYKDIFDLGFADRNTFPYQHGMLVNPHQQLLSQSKLPLVKSFGVNEISTSAEKISLLKHHFNVDIESMEGNAFHYVCLMNNIPFIQLRGISNYVGDRDKSRWKIKESLQTTFEACRIMLNQLKEDSSK